MGYTTKFKGDFALSAVPSAEVIIKLRELEQMDGREADGCEEKDNWPDSYNQWELTRDCQHLKWDGSEKFYNYVEWLQAIIDRILTPAGITLSGIVQYAGEDTDDVGVLTVESGKVIQKKLQLVSEDLKELAEFKEFVLKHDSGDEILADWRRFKGR